MRSSLKFVYDRKEQNIYIYANELRETDNPINGNDEINQQKWYILHAVNKELILLGNHPKEKLCTVTKIIKLEDLCNIKKCRLKRSMKILQTITLRTIVL
ncbi:hypothetical protein BsIDN1_45960 [Bacillus safensis]|uniref:Uncharacterized protein n=1 Tax=Bacillus safensis TaxID=561879 RepID=A0A5S9MDB6_BACIA|nr:hypothetical protein BsIDN1_45960 [Bacillus safensis]